MHEEFAHKTIATRLRAVLGESLPLDFDALATAIADDLDVAATALVVRREQQMQEALVTTMKYSTSVNCDLRARLSKVEEENQALRLQVAQLSLARELQPVGPLGTGSSSAPVE